MEFKLDKQNPSYATLTVSIAEGDYKSQFDARLKEYGKQVRIKGFRPGKVPTAMVKKMAGESLLADEVFKILSAQVQEYIKSNDIELIGEPLPSKNEVAIDFKTQKEFEFTYDLGLIPDYSLDFSDKLKLEKYDVSIDDKTLEETIDGLKKQFTITNSPEEIGEEDLIAGTVEIEGESKTLSFSISQLLKKEQTKFVGKKIEDEISFDVDKAFKKGGKDTIVGISKEELEALTGSIELKVSSISNQEDAKMDQEFFDKVLGPGKVDSEEKFLEELKNVLTSNYNRDADAFLFNKVRESLVEKTSIDLSEDFLMRWILESNRDQNLKEEDVKNEMENYMKEFKWSIIKGKISTDAGIKVEQEEVKEKALESMKMQFFGGADVPEEMNEQLLQYVDKYLQENNNRNYYNTFEQVLAEKLFDHIKTVVTINDKAISAADFKKELDKAQ